MSVLSENIKSIGRRVEALRVREENESNTWKRRGLAFLRWFWMIYHEYLRDDVTVRAQSLSYLMLFSILPLIAGAFFIFTFFAQFGMVQDAMSGAVEQFLSTIPAEHQAFVRDYVLRFKDAYLANMTQSSGSVGIFALFFLIWIGLSTFSNLDTTLNVIWSSESKRPFAEQARNFIVVVVLAPIVLAGGFSVPLILKRFVVTRYILEQVSILGVMLAYVIPGVLILAMFLAMYRFLPVRRVWWRSAFWGALFATVGLALTNVAMRIYFHYGTNTAYGKAAVVPLIGLWIYLLWLVVILGAEVSFLVQNAKDIFVSDDEGPTFKEGEGMLSVLAGLFRAHQEGMGPVSFELLRDQSGLDSEKLRRVISFLMEQEIAVECLGQHGSEGGLYVLSKDVQELPVHTLLERFFQSVGSSEFKGLGVLWEAGFAHWIKFFKKTHVADLANPPAKE